MAAFNKEEARAVGAAAGLSEPSDLKKDFTYIPLAVKFENIPNELRALRWGVWRGEPRGNGKVGKAPRNPVTGVMIGADKPHLWGTFEQAVDAYEKGGWDGIGVLMEGSCGIVGIDLDDWKNLVSGHDPLRKLLKQAKGSGVYFEHSPSGKGLRAFVKGNLPGNRGRRNGGIEIYNNARFLTVTGHGEGQIFDAKWLVDGVLELIGGEKEVLVSPVAQGGDADPVMVDALAAWAAENCSRLWEGRWNEPVTDLGGKEYGSQSQPDYGLVCTLIRQAVKRGVAEDALGETVRQVFERSGLYRPEKQKRLENSDIPKALAEVIGSLKAVHGDSGTPWTPRGSPCTETTRFQTCAVLAQGGTWPSLLASAGRGVALG